MSRTDGSTIRLGDEQRGPFQRQELLDLTPPDYVLKFPHYPMNSPQSLSVEEWKEIMEVPTVKESWGLSGEETPEEFAEMAYAAKFDFVSGSPGYAVDLYVLCGDALGEPLTLIRKGNQLAVM